ncbi:sulfatase family protein [Pelagicoccus mobilis]|uniref:Sulfatase n=1 Tax=Pelagicoccus mobilis TaxID=415221 RepID=A0A934S047_9BACT|nr:sulfatase [Pelagicoccus mobilis]MBK1877467.1 sulfatase [Pelagicoccus mobilis]
MKSQFKQAAAIALLLLAAPLAIAKPNIIFLLADDQRSDVLGSYGNALIQTPTLDKLAAQGVRFENAFCEVPICAASRATLFSGLSQRTHGFNFFENTVPAEYLPTSYPAMLKEAGYRIGFVGKYGMGFAKPGLRDQFDFFEAIGRNPYLKEMPDGNLRHETDLCVDAGIRFIDTVSEEAPFCLSISFNASHAEDGDKRPGQHFQWPESANGLYEEVEIPAPALSDDKYFEALPPFLQDKEGLSYERYFWRWDTPEKYQTNIRAYYRMITGIDNAIARLLETLKAKGLDQNTIIVYSADNGFMMGDRQTAGKWNHYDQSLSIPLIIYDPRLPQSKRGRVLTELVSNLDMAPTFVDMAGLKVPAVHQGRSLVPLIQGQTVSWRQDFFCEHLFDWYNDWHAVRSAKYKYAVYYDDDYECLYDLEKDPNELHNLAQSPEYASVRRHMIKRLEAYKSEYPKVEGAPTQTKPRPKAKSR